MTVPLGLMFAKWRKSTT